MVAKATAPRRENVPRHILFFMTIECSQSVHSIVYGIYPVEGIGVFRVPKNGDARNKKPPALRVETKRCTKKSPFRYNRVVQALL